MSSKNAFLRKNTFYEIKLRNLNGAKFENIVGFNRQKGDQLNKRTSILRVGFRYKAYNFFELVGEKS